MVSLNSLINECLEVLIFKAIEKGIDLRFEGREVEVDTVTDGNRVKQIIINLLSNAIKYTPEGNITIRIIRLTQEVLI